MNWALLALPLLVGRAPTPPATGAPAPVPPTASETPSVSPPSPELTARTADDVAQLLEDGEHEKAMALLEDVDPRDQHPPLVYMRGVVEEDRGNCPAAIDHYDHYIELDVLEVDAVAAKRRRARCERLLEAARAHTTPPPVTEPLPPPPSPRVSDERPRYADPWAISLTALGVIGVGVGAGLFGQGRADEAAADGAFDLQTYRERGERAASLQRSGVVVMAVGGGVLAVGIARFVWLSVARKRVTQESSTRGSPLRFRF